MAGIDLKVGLLPGMAVRWNCLPKGLRTHTHYFLFILYNCTNRSFALHLNLPLNIFFFSFYILKKKKTNSV